MLDGIQRVACPDAQVSGARESLINRRAMGADGFASRERRRGRTFAGALPEFRKCVVYLGDKTKGRHKLEPRCKSGAFQGIRERSHDPITGTLGKAIRWRERRRKGSHEVNVDSGEDNAIEGLP